MKKLKFKEWGKAEKERIDKLFSGDDSDWKKDSFDGLKTSLKEELFAAQNSSCAYCKQEIIPDDGRVEIDHIIPKKTAPQFTFTKRNLILTCKRCNNRKGQHNTTNQTDKYLKKLSNYPAIKSNFNWVHPYLHNYDEHISIINGCIFTVVNNSDNGRAVIQFCKLDKIPQIMSRIRIAKIKHARTPMKALLKIVGEYPETDANILATDIATVFKEVSIVKALTQINLLRGLDPSSILKNPL